MRDTSAKLENLEITAVQWQNDLYGFLLFIRQSVSSAHELWCNGTLYIQNQTHNSVLLWQVTHFLNQQISWINHKQNECALVVLSNCCGSEMCYLLVKLLAFFRRVWHHYCYGEHFNYKNTQPDGYLRGLFVLWVACMKDQAGIILWTVRNPPDGMSL